MSLADYAVEKGDDSGAPVQINATDLAGKFTEYYWRQVVPYIPQETHANSLILKQNYGKQAAIVLIVERVHSAYGGSLCQARQNQQNWQRLVNRVAVKIAEMPLWKLQVVGGSAVPFLYEQCGQGRSINVFPGVLFNLRKFYDLIRNLIVGAWLTSVREMNKGILGEATLESFLFGSERSNSPGLRQAMREVQEGRCFYCEEGNLGQGDLDHFIPWSKYPVDMGHNFVLAHQKCNRSKSNFLAGYEHLSKWHTRNQKLSQPLSARFDKDKIVHNLSATLEVARWAYSQAESAGSNLWLSSGSNFEEAGPNWRRILI
jgi:hypothetical protein